MMMSSHNNNDGESSGSSSGGGSGEFEIARVLASLRKNYSAAAAVAVEEMRGSSGGRSGESVGQGGGDGGGNNNCWGSKGKRWMSNKRVKESSSSLHSSSPSVSPLPFDLNVDQPNIFQEECLSVDVKPEKSYESTERGRVCNSAHNTGRSRHNLTEAEKEARRIRRILANRESARQTIRRRQAFHEELTRKAAEQASENERLKRNKDLAVKEFQSLQTTNQKLKGQLSQTLGFKLGENKGEAHQPSCPDTHNVNPHSANWAQFVYKKLSASTFVIPASLPPSDLNVSNLSPCSFSEQENPRSINGQNMPWCILPCPVFLPIHDIKNFSSLHVKDSDEGTSVDSNHVHSPSSDYSPSSVIRCVHNCQLVSPADRISSGLPSTQDDCRNGFHRFPFGLSLDGGGQKMIPCCSRGDFALEREDCVTPHTLVNTNVSSAACIESASALTEKRKERVLKTRERNVAGAEARKKRKELMKLKSRLHCQLIG
ncbi:uncharacterized protein LOC110729308 isoform X2 [Chenopodium quinoa]|uniref:uncharacterized protein LOC110729308 isoform X2 n=1 Tax=Chenopodium quinoa TaxID=63459 RepID=UPI000B7971A1|nr:uncharacterized protein LOC110729308 isoform X2 [Chenopodium quinoa]